MADILKYPGSISNAGVTPPFLQNTIYPASKGFGGQVSLGMGRMTRRFSDVAVSSDEGASDAQLQALYTALSQSQNANVPNLSVNLQGLQGQPGIPGLPGVGLTLPRVGGNPGFPGDDAQVVVLSATQQIFKYDGAGVIVAAQTITFTANTQNGSGDYTWAIKSPIGSTVRAFTSGGGTSDSTATLSGTDFDGWAEANAEISVTRNGITDTVYIYKIQEGTDVAIAFLTNQNHSFPATYAGVASDYSGGISEIRAYIGTTQLDYHASNASTYSLGTLVHSPASKITITESTVSSQRRLTPSAFDDATDTVSITVPVQIRNSAGTLTTFDLVLSYGKNKAGADGANGVDAFDDIDIPIPYDGWEGAFTDDSDDGTPGSQAGSVHWTAFKVKYQGDERQVVTGTSALKYGYWKASDPLALTWSNTRSDAVADGQFLVGWNSSGTFTPSQFSKLITAGFIDVVDLAALGITVVNADIGTAAIETANIKNLNIDGTKIALLAVDSAQLAAKAAETAKIDDDATKIITSAYTAGSQGPVTTSAADYESAAHAGLGNAVVVTASFQAYNTNATLYCPFYIDLYYAGSKIGSDYFMVLNSSYHVFSMSVRVASPGSGTKTAYINCYRGAGGYSTTTYMYQSYLEVNEDLGK